MIRVMVVDDHSLMRSGLRLIIESQEDLEVIAEAATGEEALNVVTGRLASDDKPAPDVVVMDLMMAGMGGVAATEAIKTASRDVQVLILTMEGEPGYLRDAFAAGASGYVLKDAADLELVDAIRTVADGGRYLHPSLGAELVRAQHEAFEGPQKPRGVGLSSREIDVLKLVAAGYANREVATELFISVRTVETHKSHIMRKTGLRTRADLVRFAKDAGIYVG